MPILFIFRPLTFIMPAEFNSIADKNVLLWIQPCLSPNNNNKCNQLWWQQTGRWAHRKPTCPRRSHTQVCS